MSKDKFIFAGMIILVVASIAFIPISAKMKSDTYNRLTGAHTTWWDTLWVELRVQEASRK